MSDAFRAIECEIGDLRKRLMSNAKSSGDADVMRHAEKCDAALNVAQVRAELLAQIADPPTRKKAR